MGNEKVEKCQVLNLIALVAPPLLRYFIGTAVFEGGNTQICRAMITSSSENEIFFEEFTGAEILFR
jgi:hypothetical protein